MQHLQSLRHLHTIILLLTQKFQISKTQTNEFNTL